MTPWFDAALVFVFGVLWLVGYVLSELDYTQKIDEGREINRRVLAALEKQHGR